MDSQLPSHPLWGASVGGTSDWIGNFLWCFWIFSCLSYFQNFGGPSISCPTNIKEKRKIWICVWSLVRQRRRNCVFLQLDFFFGRCHRNEYLTWYAPYWHMFKMKKEQNFFIIAATVYFGRGEIICIFQLVFVTWPKITYSRESPARITLESLFIVQHTMQVLSWVWWIVGGECVDGLDLGPDLVLTLPSINTN